MAVGLAISSAGGQYNGKMTPFVLLSCMVAATGGVIFGYDIGISGLNFILKLVHLNLQNYIMLKSANFMQVNCYM